jgi:hypothetical protein
MKYVLCGLLTMSVIPSAYCALPGDGVDGQRLHDANCVSCHDSSVYTRSNRTIRSLDALQQQISGCEHLVKKEFSSTETQNLVKYLNDRFYHFQ